MLGEIGERWRLLCEQATKEQDPVELLALTQGLVRMLDEKEKRLKQKR